MVTWVTQPLMPPPTSTSSPTSNGLNTMIKRPLAKLLSVPCNAKATTKPAAPMTASKGARVTSSADKASRKPTGHDHAPGGGDDEVAQQLRGDVGPAHHPAQDQTDQPGGKDRTNNVGKKDPNVARHPQA